MDGYPSHHRSFREAIRGRWNATPVSKPHVDPDLERLDPLSRSAEVFRYSILSVEFWISKNGHLREWLRQNLGLAAWLVIPVFLVMPLITLALKQLVVWTASLVGLVGKLVILPVLGLLAAFAFSVVGRIFRIGGR